MKHLFVPCELALLAKEKGFNEPCFTYWIDFKNGSWQLDSINIKLDGVIQYEENDKIIAPLYQQLVDWFREMHGINICCIKDAYDKTGEPFDAYLQCKRKVLHRYNSKFYGAFNDILTEAFKLIQ